MWEQSIKKELNAIEESHLKRRFMETSQATECEILFNERLLLNFATNNYLGLAGDKRLVQAQITAAERSGAGATASRLVTGNHEMYRQAELALQNWKQNEHCLIVNSGYTANIGVLTSLLGRHDVVYSDRLNHASITDGIIQSRAEHKRYRHNDLNHLERLLKKASPNQKKLIVTDSVFSMDGDCADLQGLTYLKNKYDALLVVDEAHASGIYGPSGRGLVYEYELENEVDVQIGTFSKALGSFGAYISGKSWLIEYFVNTMRSLIFTTALPPAVLGSIEKAIEIVRLEQNRRERLLQKANLFRNELNALGFNTCGSETQIIPILVGSNEAALQFSLRLREAGIAAIAIRPPTVPHNEARIRFAVTSELSEGDIRHCIYQMNKIGHELGVIGSC